MELEIHGNKLHYNGEECGIYKSHTEGICVDYAVMNFNNLIDEINLMEKDDAIEFVRSLRDLAKSQLENQPKNLGFPIQKKSKPLPKGSGRCFATSFFLVQKL